LFDAPGVGNLTSFFQLIWMVLQPTNLEYYITVAALPASLIVLLAGHLGARYESRPLMYAFMLSCAGACGYFTFKVTIHRFQIHRDFNVCLLGI
jgi:hypothetical protein